jgi:hypothetical protein
MTETETLVKAALAVCDRWDTPDWSDHRHTADFIRDLRAAAAVWNTRPSVDRDRIAVCIATHLSLGLGIDLPCVETDKIADAILALLSASTVEG